MPTSKLPVIAAIPNYNMADSLQTLLAQLVKADYDAIYVLDDASTDTSEAVVAQFTGVRFIRSPHNGGAGAARNLILQHLKGDAIIHFLDADVTLETKHAAQRIRTLNISKQTGFIGGLVLRTNGSQDQWNYGPRPSVATTLSVGFYALAFSLHSIPVLKQLVRLFPRRPQGITGRTPKHPYWVLESNFIIRLSTLRRYGGFDASIREHDIQPLAFRLYEAGVKNGFCPDIVVTRRTDVNVRHYNRLLKLAKSEFYLIRHYFGWRRYIFGRS